MARATMDRSVLTLEPSPHPLGHRGTVDVTRMQTSDEVAQFRGAAC